MSLREGLDQGVHLPSAPPTSPDGWIPPLETPPPPSSPIRPPTPDSEVSFSEEHSLWTVVSPLLSLGEVEESHHSGLLVLGGGSGDHGGIQGFGGGAGIILDNHIPQFA